MPTLDYERPPARDDGPNLRRVACASLAIAVATFGLGVVLHHAARADGSSRVTAAYFVVVVWVGAIGFLIGLAAIAGPRSRWLGVLAATTNLTAAAVGGLRLAMLA